MDERKFKWVWWFGGGLVLLLILLGANLLLDESAPDLTGLLPDEAKGKVAEEISPQRQQEWMRWAEQLDEGRRALFRTGKLTPEQVRAAEWWDWLSAEECAAFLQRIPEEFWPTWETVAREGVPEQTLSGLDPHYLRMIAEGVQVNAKEALLRKDWRLAAQRVEELLLVPRNLMWHGNLQRYDMDREFKWAGMVFLRALVRTEGIPVEVLRRLRERLDAVKISEEEMKQALKRDFAHQLVWNDVEKTWEKKMDAVENDYPRTGPNFTFKNFRWAVFPRVLKSAPRSMLYKPHATQRLAAGFYRELLLLEKASFQDVELIRKNMIEVVWGNGFWRRLSLENFIGKIVAAESLAIALDKRQWHLALLSRLEAAEAALALREYEMARGNLPESLEELVPEYLPAVPVDRTDGNSVRYAKRLRAVWIVGEENLREPPEERGGVEVERNVFRLPPLKAE